MPSDARVIDSESLLWTIGHWPSHLLRSAEAHGDGARLVVLGPCAATRSELQRAAAAQNLGEAVRGWSGAFTAVRMVNGEVKVVTDASGSCPVYMACTDAGVTWASSALALAARTGSAPDLGWLAAYLADRQRIPGDRTAFASVARVPPGHILRVGRGASATVTSWWRLPTPLPYQEAVREVRRTLTEGVASRISGNPLSTDLAGTDSTSLAVIAAQHAPVTGWTVHREGHTEGGDMSYARRLNVHGLARREFPLRAMHMPFSQGPRLPPSDEPAPSAHVWALLSAQLAVATNTHLTGDGGDSLFLPPPTHLAELARHRRFLRLTADAMAWAKLRRTSPWPAMRRAVHLDVPGLARPTLLAPPAWVRPVLEGTEPAPRTANEALVADIRMAARSAQADVQVAAGMGVDLHNPYFDAALLDAVLSAPAPLRFSAYRYKPLLLDAVGDFLPEPHRRRAAKGIFGGDFFAGLRASLPALLALCDGRLAGYGLIDPEPLRVALRAAALGARTVWPPLIAVLCAELWLEALESAPTILWHPVREQAAR